MTTEENTLDLTDLCPICGAPVVKVEWNKEHLKSVSKLQQERDRLADKVNSLLQTVSDRNQRIDMLEYTLDEVAAREDEREEQEVSKTKIPEIVIPIKIEVRS